jgi:hypothetical protein
MGWRLFVCGVLMCMGLAFMVEEKRMAQVWISWETYRRLLGVRGAMCMADGRIRNFDEVISELIDFWEKHVV